MKIRRSQIPTVKKSKYLNSNSSKDVVFAEHSEDERWHSRTQRYLSEPRHSGWPFSVLSKHPTFCELNKDDSCSIPKPNLPHWQRSRGSFRFIQRIDMTQCNCLLFYFRVHLRLIASSQHLYVNKFFPFVMYRSNIELIHVVLWISISIFGTHWTQCYLW